MEAAHAITGASQFVFAIRAVSVGEEAERPARSSDLYPHHRVGKALWGN